MTGRRLIESAFLLPWLGVFLLTPPVVLILQSWSKATGFPLFIVYVFGCWLALIVLGGILSIRLARLDDGASHDEGDGIRRREEIG